MHGKKITFDKIKPNLLTNMILQLTNAMKSQLIIEFHYDAEIRIVEPHCHGVSTKGNHILRAFQIDGFSSSGRMGWKLYDMSKVQSITVLEQIFAIRPDYNKGDKGMVTIHHEL